MRRITKYLLNAFRQNKLIQNCILDGISFVLHCVSKHTAAFFQDINPRILHEYNGETCYKPKRYVDVKMKSIVATYLSVFEEHTHT